MPYPRMGTKVVTGVGVLISPGPDFFRKALGRVYTWAEIEPICEKRESQAKTVEAREQTIGLGGISSQSECHVCTSRRVEVATSEKSDCIGKAMTV